MTTTTSRTIPGRDLKVGDAIVFLGRSYPVLSLEPYEIPVEWVKAQMGPARIAYSYDDWCITVLDTSTVEVVGG